jgi:dTDP-4-amino-4,6-dideoxygalactose transaminase
MSRDAWKKYSSKGGWYYEIKACGFKYNMTAIQASIGIRQLRKLPKFIEIKKRYAQIYDEKLGKSKEIITPFEKPNVKHVYHLYPILLVNYD